MELHGSIENNLTSAIESARRLRGHPVHSATLDHWSAILAHARQALAERSTEPIQALIVDLENELADRVP